MAEFDQVLRLQPESAEIHQALSEALFEKGDLDGASPSAVKLYGWGQTTLGRT